MKGNSRKKLLDAKLILAMGAILLLMLATAPSFYSSQNLLNIVSNASINGIVAMGVTLLMVGGGFDMSVGSIMVVSGIVTTMLVRVIGVPLAILIGIFLGIPMGLLNGILVAKFRVNAFIATLGTMVIFQGIAFSLTNMKPVSARSPVFQMFANYELFKGVPIVVLYFLIAVIVIWFVAHFTGFGKYVYAVGGNKEAARMMGIRVDFYCAATFVISGFFAAFAGVALASKIDAASAVFGENIALPVVASVVIGGVSLSGGVGRVLGVVQGIFLLALVENVVMYMGLVGYYQLLFRALVLLGVVIFDVTYARLSEKMLERTTFAQSIQSTEREEPCEEGGGQPSEIVSQEVHW